MSILKFTAEWCGPCQNPELKKAITTLETLHDLKVEVVDIDEKEDVANKHKVASIPLFVFLDEQGNELSRVIGFDESAIAKGFDAVKKIKSSQISLPISKEATLNHGK